MTSTTSRPDDPQNPHLGGYAAKKQIPIIKFILTTTFGF
jgi:hypothetical protein